MSADYSDRNLLFGILALQMDFVSRDALIKAMHAWVLQKSTSLGQILLDQGALRPDTHALLQALVQKHLEVHGGDMPVFLEPEKAVMVPLETTYRAAFDAVPRRWQRVLETPAQS